MAVDRTLELLECLEQGGGEKGSLRVAALASNGATGLRRRHKKERFAVEDHLSPSLRMAEASLTVTGDSSSDAEGSTTPPRGTFLAEAQAIVSKSGESKTGGIYFIVWNYLGGREAAPCGQKEQGGCGEH